MAFADFDGDGKLDLAEAISTGNDNPPARALRIRFGAGNGMFPSSKSYPFEDTETDDYYFIVVADFDGDSAPDLAVRAEASVYVFYNAGNGTFHPPLEIGASYPNPQDAQALRAADIDGDGLPELLVNASQGGAVIDVYTSQGTTFAPTPALATLSQPETGFAGPYPFAAADLNGDGRAEVVAAHVVDSANVASYAILMNDGGALSPPSFLASAYPTLDVLLGDVDDDGHVDIIGIDSTFPSVEVLLGKGNGEFVAPIVSAFTSAAIFQGQTVTAFQPGSVLVDVTGDGVLDLVVTTPIQFDGVDVLQGNGDGTFSPLAAYTSGGPGVVSGDVNGDGKPDLLLPTSDYSGGALLLNQGGGVFQGPTFQPLADLAAWDVLAAGDINHDGRPDLVAVVEGTDTESLRIYETHGGTFIETASYPASDANAIAIADLNGDGWADLVIASNTLDVWMNKGDGTFDSPVHYVAIPDNELTPILLGDLDGDGALDVVLIRGDVEVFLNNGNGTLAPEVSYGDTVAEAGIYGGVLGDFNGDGVLDVATVADGISASVILLGTGGGVLGQQIEAPTCPGGALEDRTEIVAADFDQDGQLDLAFGCERRVEVVFQKNGSLALPVEYSNIPSFQKIAVADFNADGFPDLLFGLASSALLLNDGKGTFAVTGAYLTGDEAILVDANLIVADFDGDGAPDLAQPELFPGFPQGGGISLFRTTCLPLLDIGPGLPSPGRPPLLRRSTARPSAPSTRIRCLTYSTTMISRRSLLAASVLLVVAGCGGQAGDQLPAESDPGASPGGAGVAGSDAAAGNASATPAAGTTNSARGGSGGAGNGGSVAVVGSPGGASSTGGSSPTGGASPGAGAPDGTAGMSATAGAAGNVATGRHPAQARLSSTATPSWRVIGVSVPGHDTPDVLLIAPRADRAAGQDSAAQ